MTEPLLDDPDLAPPDFDDEPVEQEQPAEEVVTELTPEERLLFSQLITVGQRTKTIDVMGHTVVVQSLRVSDDLRIGLYCRPYEGSKMEHRAYQLAACAAGIRSIDGMPLYQSMTTTEGDDEVFAHNVKLLGDYYPIVITEIYREVLSLDQEFAELAIKLGKFKG